MSDNIVNRLDNYINKLSHSSFTLTKDKALKIIDMLIKEDKDYKLMLTFLRENIELYYDHPNECIRRHFKKVLEFYNIIPSSSSITDKRTIVESIGDEKVITHFKVRCKDKILQLL